MKTAFSSFAVALLFITLPSWAQDPPSPAFTDHDQARKQIKVGLVQLATGFEQITDLQFVPDQPGIALILEKEGRIQWLSLKDGKKGLALSLKVRSESEQGVLGLAFHPQFEKNRKVYLNYNPASGPRQTRISEFLLNRSNKGALNATQERVLLEINQPYGNHKAGQLAFGPDGYLYIGTGDGGSANDPQGNGQNPKSLLGKMLRIDVNPSDGRPYTIPKDNPFVSDSKFAPEIWAWGLRNPWRYSFGPAGQLIVADVGQNRWEEINTLERGKNYGWNIREAKHCFKPAKACKEEGLTDPVLEYGRDDGASITGGYVYTGKKIPELSGKYVFGDFVSGRIWAADLKTWEMYALGKWGIMLATFGRDREGEIYVTDFGRGVIYRLAPKK